MEEIQAHLSFSDQLSLFESRGLIINDREKNVRKLENISYYKFKEFAYPLSKIITSENGEKERRYDGVSFDTVLTRYYQDKNLRVNLLHAIEKIEVSLKTKVAYVLGENYKAFGYLTFSSWCNREEYCRYYLQDQQKKFKNRLREKIRLSNSHDIKDKKNLNNEGFPTIWLTVDVLTFGDVIEMLRLMSKKNLKKIASGYNCSPEELTSWLSGLKFIRNICAHNSNIIDLKLNTTPKLRDEWKPHLYQFQNRNGYSNRIAVIFFITKHFISCINENYSFANIGKSLAQIVNGNPKGAELLGFKDKASFQVLFPKPNYFNRNYNNKKNYKK